MAPCTTTLASVLQILGNFLCLVCVMLKFLVVVGALYLW
jgi:hypothetical protein